MKTVVMGNLKSKTSLVGLALLVLGGLDQSGVLTQLLDLVPVEYRGTAVSVLGGLMVLLRNLTTVPVVDKAAPPTQGGFARVSMLVTLLLLAASVTFFAGCTTNPATGGQELSESGKVALQASARIATRRYLADHPGRSAEIIANVRRIAAQLQTVTEDTTVSGLRFTVEAELTKHVSNPTDLGDIHDLFDVFEAVLREQIGKDEIDSASLVKVNEFADMIVASLPK